MQNNYKAEHPSCVLWCMYLMKGMLSWRQRSVLYEELEVLITDAPNRVLHQFDSSWLKRFKFELRLR